MRKTRLLNSIDFGVIRNDGKYSQSASDANVPFPEEEAFYNLHLQYCAGARYKYSSNYYQQQTEVFESSEHHKPRFNDCKHTKCKTVCLPYTTWAQYTATRRYVAGARRVRSLELTTPWDHSIDWNVVSSNMQAEAYHTMIPRFEGDISMINFLFEMKDFRDISFQAFKRIPRILGSPSLMGSMHTATKRVAEAHLLKTFAIDPLIDDTVGIIQQAQNLVMDVQEKFKDAGLTPESRHFSRPLNRLHSLTYLGPIFTYTGLYKGNKLEQVWNATMEGDYGYRNRSNLDAFAQYWGLKPTAEAVWNAIPFSFLADYFISIGHALNVMRHDKNVSYNVRQYSESITSLSTSGHYVGPRETAPCDMMIAVDNKAKPVFVGNPKTFFVTGNSSSLYERVVKKPYWGPYLPKWKIPKGKQFLNMAALLRCLL